MAVDTALTPIDLAILVYLEQHDRPSGLTHDQIAAAVRPSPIMEALGKGIDAELMFHPGEGRSATSRNRYRISLHGREQMRAHAKATGTVLEQMISLTDIPGERARLEGLRGAVEWAKKEAAKRPSQQTDEGTATVDGDGDPAPLPNVVDPGSAPTVTVRMPARRSAQVGRLAAKLRRSDAGEQPEPKRIDTAPNDAPAEQ